MLKTATSTLIGLGVVVGGAVAPIIPAEMTWEVSYETYLYNTPDGLLHEGEYTEDQDGVLVYEDGTVRRWPDEDTQIKSLEGLTKVEIIDKAYYEVFRDSSRKLFVDKIEKSAYEALRGAEPRKPEKKDRTSILEAVRAEAAITAGNTANSGVLAAVTSATFSLNNNKEDVLVGVAIRDERTANTATATYAGAAMTADANQSQQDDNSTGDLRSYVFRKQSAATGANNVVVTFNGTVDHVGVFALAVDDLNDTGQPDAISTAGENEPGVSVTIDTGITTVAANTIIFDVGYGKDGTDYTVGSGRTQVGQLGVNGGGDRAFASYVIKSAAGSYTIDWAFTTYGDDYTHSVASYLQTAAPVVESAQSFAPVILWED